MVIDMVFLLRGNQLHSKQRFFYDENNSVYVRTYEGIVWCIVISGVLNFDVVIQ